MSAEYRAGVALVIVDRWQVHFNTTGGLGGMLNNEPLANHNPSGWGGLSATPWFLAHGVSGPAEPTQEGVN